MAYRNYSRLEKVERQKNVKSAIIYITLTIAFLLFMAFFGISLFTQVAGVLFDLNGSTTVDISDTTPPAAPFTQSIPEFTNKEELIVEGNSETGSTVSIKLNETKKEVVTDAKGTFSARLLLDKGENILIFTASDGSGNESLESRRWVVTFDNENPDLEITKPKEGETFFGSKQKQLTLEGKTDPEAHVTINDRVVIVGSSGNFSFPTTLSDGENSFNIKSTDKAGNQTETTVKVTYNP